MASEKLPYVSQPGAVMKVFEKAKTAETPERFTQDFLETVLSCKGGGYRQFISYAKKLGLLGSDGKPTDIYKQYRNPTTSKTAIAKAMRIGYGTIFQKNEYAYKLSIEDLKGLVVEISGRKSGDRVVQLICQLFEEIKKLADFETEVPTQTTDQNEELNDSDSLPTASVASPSGFSIAYNINLVLPKTDDPAVFNAIFKSLKDNLLRN